MSSATAIDLSKVPFPDVVEELSFETLFAQMAESVRLGIPGVIDPLPDFDETIESDPAVKVLQAAAHWRLFDRQRVNDAAMAVMVAYATGADLDNLAVLAQVTRLAGESDDDLRERIILAPESYSVAGPELAYIYHALSADPDVADASATSPSPGEVVVSILSRTGDGEAGAPLIATVASVLTADEIRPLTDSVTVQSATIVEYSITASLWTFSGPDRATVLAEAAVKLDAYVAESRKIGRDITRNGIGSALRVAGVQNVTIASPAADVVISSTQAAHCTGIILNDMGTAA
ncbi:hypothetical protein MMA231_02488 [Asticcacaulis sp. MM231]|uniref:baseplate assembly protein n=1 Tax=Asticcacaulis sp. MM231 TaxID=3157666 RepID=UPI0032D5909C